MAIGFNRASRFEIVNKSQTIRKKITHNIDPISTIKQNRTFYQCSYNQFLEEYCAF